MKTVQKIQEELENECYLKETGFTTFAQVEPGGTQNGLGYNASGFDVVRWHVMVNLLRDAGLIDLYGGEA